MITTFTSYFTLFEIIFGTIFGIVATVLFSWLLNYFYSKKFSDTSLTMIFYIIVEFFTSIFNILYLVYVGMNWKNVNTINSAVPLFWFGLPSLFLCLFRPIVVFFLGLERIACVEAPLHHQAKIKVIFVGLSILISVCFVLYFCLTGLIHVPTFDKTECLALGCMMTADYVNIYVYSKDVIAVGNIIIGIRLAYLIKKKVMSVEGQHKSNRLILITVILSVLFDVVPHILSNFLVNYLFNINASAMVGPLTPAIISIESAGCAILYFKTYKKQCQKTTTLYSHTPIFPILVKTVSTGHY